MPISRVRRLALYATSPYNPTSANIRPIVPMPPTLPTSSRVVKTMREA
jgi:hypothetical protein